MSSNKTLIHEVAFSVACIDNHYTVSITPANNQVGQSSIHVMVSYYEGLSTPILIGARPFFETKTQTNPPEYYYIQLDDIRLWKTIRTLDQIQSHLTFDPSHSNP